MRSVKLGIALLLNILSVALSGQERVEDMIGDRLYNYSTSLYDTYNPINDLRLLDFDIHCVEVFEVLDSQIPKVDFELVDQDQKILVGISDKMVLWKGFEGPDPFLGVEGKYYQFKDGVPLYNLEEPSDFDREGELNIYLEYKITELPEDINIWCTLLEYERLKVKIKVDYKTTYLGQHAYPFSEVVSHELGKKVVFEVMDMQVRKAEEWIEISMDDHPSLPTYFRSVSLEDVTIADFENPLGRIIRSISPENSLVFRNKDPLIDLPVCNDSELQIYVYPNPTFGDITIRIEDNGNGPYAFELYNVVGHPLLKETLESSESTIVKKFDLSYLDKGIYLYGIKDRRGVLLQTKRLVVVKR